MNASVPKLPPDAPFAPAQRAWLDGFLAALLGDEARADRDAALPDDASSDPATPSRLRR